MTEHQNPICLPVCNNGIALAETLIGKVFFFFIVSGSYVTVTAALTYKVVREGRIVGCLKFPIYLCLYLLLQCCHLQHRKRLEYPANEKNNYEPYTLALCIIYRVLFCGRDNNLFGDMHPCYVESR